MDVIVIGLGSMGKRRIRLLKENPSINISGIDSNQERANQVKDLYGVSCFNSIAEAIKEKHPRCAFICTSPLSLMPISSVNVLKTRCTYLLRLTWWMINMRKI